mmetsp:Transcript_27885/g.28156  ORF Transcript_27885/g.28156 Transcript_27885/m.28156 type:complete len:423 (-) Transcript_27885:354-1622(-)
MASDSDLSTTYFLCSEQGTPVSAVSSKSLYSFSDRPKSFWINLARLVATFGGLSSNSSSSFSFYLRGETYFVQPLKNHLPFFVVLFSSTSKCALDLLMIAAQFGHMLSICYENPLRRISIDLATKARRSSNKGTFSTTMEATEDIDDDLQFNFALIEEYFISPILQGQTPKLSWQSHVTLLQQNTPPIYMVYNTVRPLFMEITTTRLNRSSHVIGYRSPSHVPPPLFGRVWVELARVCLSIEKSQPKVTGAQLAPGLHHCTRVVGLCDDISEVSALAPVSDMKELGSHMLLLSTLSTMPQLSLAMLVPKRDINLSRSCVSGCQLQIANMNDIPSALQDLWIAALTRVAAMFPSSDHITGITESMFASTLDNCSSPSGSSSKTNSTRDASPPKKPIMPAAPVSSPSTRGKPASKPGRQIVSGR